MIISKILYLEYKKKTQISESPKYVASDSQLTLYFN